MTQFVNISAFCVSAFFQTEKREFYLAKLPFLPLLNIWIFYSSKFCKGVLPPKSVTLFRLKSANQYMTISCYSFTVKSVHHKYCFHSCRLNFFCNIFFLMSFCSMEVEIFIKLMIQLPFKAFQITKN